MNFRTLLQLFSLVIFSLPGISQGKPTAEAQQLYEKMIRQINPRHVQWINNQSREAREKSLSSDSVMARTRSYAVLGSMNGQDIEAICFLVLMQASKSSQEDLKAIMAQVKSINAQKAAIRQTLTALKDNRSVKTAQLDSLKFLHSKTQAIQKGANPDAVRFQGSANSRNPVSKQDLDAIKEQMEKDQDSLSEMGEMESLRLQMIMDRMSKMESMISNIMAKISKTSDAIIQNLK